MELFITYLAAVVALMIIPGPDMAYCAASGLAHGRRGAFFAATGIGTGGMVLVVVAAVLIFFAHEADGRLISGIQFLGCLYLLYLAVVVILPRHETGSGEGGVKPVETTAGQIFGRGIITNISNPKALVFILSFIPQFIPAGSVNPALHVVWLGAVLCVIGTGMNFGFGLLGSTASPLNRIVILNRSLAQYILSAVFAVVAVGFLLVLRSTL